MPTSITSSSTEVVECSEQPLGISFHPSRDLVVAGLVDGTIELHDYGQLLISESTKNAEKTGSDEDVDDTILSSTSAHTKSCRSVLFSNIDDNLLYSCGYDASITGLCIDRACNISNPDIMKDCFAWRIRNAHPNGNGIHRMFQLPKTSHAGPLIATGDDEGIIRLFDTRLCDGGNNSNTINSSLPSACVAEWKNHTDYITGFTCKSDGQTLLSTSGDCTLSIYDVRKPKISTKSSSSSKNASKDASIVAQSEHQEDELLSLTLLKNETKLLTGTQEGVLTVWSYGKWQDHCDRFPGPHPSSIDAILKVDEDTVITGSSDGLLRVVQILPDKVLGVLGDHDGFPIEELRFERERRVFGSVSHDEYIRLWDSSFFNEDNDNDDDQNSTKNDDKAMDLGHVSMTGVTRAGDTIDSEDDWEDIEDEDDDEDVDMDKGKKRNNNDDDDKRKVDSDSDSDDTEDGKNGKSGRGGKYILKTDNEKFFEDL